MIDFVINVLAVTLALALVAMIAWPIVCMLPFLAYWSIAVDILVMLAVAIVFVFFKGSEKCLLAGQWVLQLTDRSRRHRCPKPASALS